MLFQGNQEIKIIVRRESGGGGGKDTAPKGTGETNVEEEKGGGATPINSTANSSNSERNRKRARVIATHGVATSRQLLNFHLNYELTGLGYEKGDSAYQQGVQRSWELVNDFSSIATSTVMGITYGASGGPVGMLAGAVYGLASSGASVWTKYAYRRRDYEINLFKENSSIQYQRARANSSGTTGRLR